MVGFERSVSGNQTSVQKTILHSETITFLTAVQHYTCSVLVYVTFAFTLKGHLVKHLGCGICDIRNYHCRGILYTAYKLLRYKQEFNLVEGLSMKPDLKLKKLERILKHYIYFSLKKILQTKSVLLNKTIEGTYLLQGQSTDTSIRQYALYLNYLLFKWLPSYFISM